MNDPLIDHVISQYVDGVVDAHTLEREIAGLLASDEYRNAYRQRHPICCAVPIVVEIVTRNSVIDSRNHD